MRPMSFWMDDILLMQFLSFFFIPFTRIYASPLKSKY